MDFGLFSLCFLLLGYIFLFEGVLKEGVESFFVVNKGLGYICRNFLLGFGI